MCLAPRQLEDGTEVACRECWQCRARKIDDWIGRCIAESKTSVVTRSITLTYGADENGSDDHPRARWLTYSDVQKYFKKLRKAGYAVRYFVVGEYGSRKGRAHWHLIAFFPEKAPTHELDKKFKDEFWEHGFSFWQTITTESVKYVCKYIHKDVYEDGRQGHMSMSRLPPLGAAYFRELAGRYVAARLAPQSLNYEFDEIRHKTGTKYQFILSGKSAELFLDAYVAQWALAYPNEHVPNSDVVEEYLDAQVPEDLEFRFQPRGIILKRPPENRLLWWMKKSDIVYAPTSGWSVRKGASYLWYWTRHANGDTGWKFVDLDKLRAKNKGRATRGTH